MSTPRRSTRIAASHQEGKKEDRVARAPKSSQSNKKAKKKAKNSRELFDVAEEPFSVRENFGGLTSAVGEILENLDNLYAEIINE